MFAARWAKVNQFFASKSSRASGRAFDRARYGFTSFTTWSKLKLQNCGFKTVSPIRVRCGGWRSCFRGRQRGSWGAPEGSELHPNPRPLPTLIVPRPPWWKLVIRAHCRVIKSCMSGMDQIQKTSKSLLFLCMISWAGSKQLKHKEVWSTKRECAGHVK